MLNFDTIKFIDMSAQCDATIKSKLMIGAAVMITAALLTIAVKSKGKLDKLSVPFMCIGLIAFISMVNATGIYCQAIVQVEPTEEITIEQMRKDKNFEEIDGQIFFKCDIYKSYLEKDEDFKGKEHLMNKVQKEFDSVKNDIWVKERTEGKVK